MGLDQGDIGQFPIFFYSTAGRRLKRIKELREALTASRTDPRMRIRRRSFALDLCRIIERLNSSQRELSGAMPEVFIPARCAASVDPMKARKSE